MRRKFSVLTFLVFCFSLSGCGAKSISDVKPQNVKATPASVTAPSIPKDGDYNGRGVVTKINLELGSIELNHENMPGLMDAMIMEFYVKDKKILENLAVGDKVDFVVEYKHPQEVITSIKKAQ